MNPAQVCLASIVLMLTSISLSAQDIPEVFHGGWVLEGYMKDGVLKAPQTAHLVLLDPQGTLVRAKMIGKEWEKEEAQPITITDKGEMFLVTPEGVKVPLGSATISSDGKLHLIDREQKRHLVYSKFDPITIK